MKKKNDLPDNSLSWGISFLKFVECHFKVIINKRNSEKKHLIAVHSYFKR